jgi:fructokinase
MNARPLVVGLGEILWDLLPSGRQMGGAPANFAFHARSLGAESVVVSAVGDDEPGRAILAELDRRGLDRSGIATVPSVPTGLVAVELDAAGVPRYKIREGVAWDTIPWQPRTAELASTADAVCYGTLAQRSDASRRTIDAFLAATRPACLRVLDLNLRQAYYSRDLVHGLLSRSNVLKLNDDELRTVAGLLSLPGTEAEVLEGLLTAYPLTMIALTKGAGGSLFCGPGCTARHFGVPVAAVDTVGAGDAFTAALVVGMLKGKSWSDIGETANRLASHVCTQKGAWPDVPADISAWGSE